MFLGSSAVEQPAVNRLVASSNLARGATQFLVEINFGDKYIIWPRIKRAGFFPWPWERGHPSV